MDVFLIDKRKFPTFSIKLFWPLARLVDRDVASQENDNYLTYIEQLDAGY